MPQYKTITTDKCYSEVAQAGSNTLCVTVPELIECGINDYTLRDGLKRNRQGLVYCWSHHKEGNCIYVHYDGLKDKYKRLIDSVHCSGIDAHVWTMNRDAQTKEQQLLTVCKGLATMVEVSVADMEALQKTKYFQGVEVQQLSRAAGWLRLWRNLSVKRAREMGFATIKQLQEALFEHCTTEQNKGLLKFPRSIHTIRVLDRKAREFATEGLNSLIGGYYGNANRDKIDGLIHAVLMDLASSPLKYSFEDISMMYNTMEQYAHLERMTTSAIKKHLNKPTNHKIWYYLRNGKLAGDNIYQPLALRERPAKPDYLWSIDGTTSQLYYRDDSGKIRSDLYVYFVTDAHSGAIIGSAIAFTETSDLVIEALQDAITKHSHKPHQIQYDNSSANVQGVVQGLMSNMSRVHFPCTPYLGRAKYVESIIGHFQQRTLRQYKNFKGGNITTRSINSKANPELLKWLKDNQQELPSAEGVIEQMHTAIEQWNERGERRDSYGRWVGESKMALYSKPYYGRLTLNHSDKLSLFMVELSKLYKYTQQGIKITIAGKKYYYIVPDPDNTANDFMFSNENMYGEFKVRVNINDPEQIELFTKEGRPMARAIEKTLFKSAVADMGANDSAKVMDFVKKQEQYGYSYTMRAMRNDIERLRENGLKATGTDGFYDVNEEGMLGWIDTCKNINNTIESRREDERNGMITPTTTLATTPRATPSLRTQRGSRNDTTHQLNKM